MAYRRCANCGWEGYIRNNRHCPKCNKSTLKPVKNKSMRKGERLYPAPRNDNTDENCKSFSNDGTGNCHHKGVYGTCGNCEVEEMRKLLDKDTERYYGKTDYADEEPNCKHFRMAGNDPNINICVGNEPHSCHRAKKEKECWKLNGKTPKI